MENAAPQIYTVGCGDDHASAARLRPADLSTTTFCALRENDVLRNAVEGTLSAEDSHRRMGMFQYIGEARIAY